MSVDRFETDLTQVQGIADSIEETSPGQRHSGIFYRSRENDTLHFLHLRWHYRLSNSVPPIPSLFVVPKIPRSRAHQVAAICRLIWRSNEKRVPYAFSNPESCFDRESGLFLSTEKHLGLTCASFVLAVFDTARIPLVDYSSWPKDRTEDRAWQAKIIQLLRDSGAAQEHIEQVEAEIGKARFRPEEVAAAAALYPPMVNFGQNLIDTSNRILSTFFQEE